MSDQEFDFFFQLDTIICLMLVISIEVAWSCLFWLGPSSSEMTILKTSHVSPRTRLEIPRSSRG